MRTDKEVGPGNGHTSPLGHDYGEVLWRPGPELIERARITDYRRWLASASPDPTTPPSASPGPTTPPSASPGPTTPPSARGVAAASASPDSTAYRELWEWSVTEPGAFWGSLWDYFGVVGERGTGPVLTGRMPDVTWFPGATLNYARNALRTARTDPARTAVIARGEDGGQTVLSDGELAAEVARVRAGLRALGVTKGDRVAAYLPNIPAALIGLLATASLGAIWSSCSPDFGPSSVIDRFAQITPKVLLAVQEYRYGGKHFDRGPQLAEIAAALPGLTALVVVNHRGGAIASAPQTLDFGSLLGGPAAELEFEEVPFSHPLWVLYSSGTTGLPKAIVLEVPVRKILLGTPVADAADPDALANPEVLAWFAR